MEFNTLGKSDLVVSQIGYGTWGLGGDSYGDIALSDSIKLLRKAKDLGINFYETADVYGNGRSEVAVGEAFGTANRGEVVIATKGGNLPHTGFVMPQDFSRTYLENALNLSLGRLKTDYVDIYMLHSPDVENKERVLEAVEVIQNLKRAGKAKSIGVAFRSPEDAKIILNCFKDIDIISINFNVIDHRFLDSGLSKICEENKIGVIGRTPLCFGFLSGRFKDSSDLEFNSDDHRKYWPKNQLIMWSRAYEKFQNIITRYGMSPTDFALTFCRSYASVSTSIVGMMSEDEIKSNINSSKKKLFDLALLNEISDIYKNHKFYDPSSKIINND